MLRKGIEFLGADYVQWRAITRASLKLDHRTASMGVVQQQGTGASPGHFRIWFARLWIYAFMGAMISGIVWMNKDVFFTGTVLLTYSMVMTAMLVLIDFGAVVISPEDFAILGYQPVSSRTYFLARLANVLVYTTFLSLTLGIIPIVLFFFTLGFRPLLGLAAAVATVLSGAAVAMCLVLIYAGVLRVIHPKRLRRAVSYVQLLMSFFIYGGYMFLPRLVDARSIGTMTLDKSLPLFLLPSTWFASYLDLARGRIGLSEVIPALFSLAAFGWLLHRAQGRLALEYADRLATAAAMSEGKRKVSGTAARPAVFFRNREARAVSLLVRNQFKYDQKFRLAVLSILPLTILYLFMGLRSGPIVDPFVSRGAGMGQSWLLYFAALLFPVMMRTSLINSDSYQASWVYYATPADREQLVLWSKNYIIVFFLLPYLLFIGAIFLYFYANAGHVLLQLVVLGLFAHFFLQFSVLLNPALPFSQPPRKGQRTANVMLPVLFGPFAALLMLWVFARWVYPNPAVLFSTLAALAGAGGLLEGVLRRQIRRRVVSLEYQG